MEERTFLIRDWLLFAVIIAIAFVGGAVAGGTGITLLHTCGTDRCGPLVEQLVAPNPVTGVISAVVVGGLLLIAGRRRT